MTKYNYLKNIYKIKPFKINSSNHCNGSTLEFQARLAGG